MTDSELAQLIAIARRCAESLERLADTRQAERGGWCDKCGVRHATH